MAEISVDTWGQFGQHSDEIIDVRAPSEYAEDHIPGAINLPVLDDEERALVGRIYKQDSPFKARKVGASLVSKNISRHLSGHFADKDGGYRPAVYCWRGGQRSLSLATILQAVGWRTSLLEGGYKSYRHAVVSALYEKPITAKLIVVDGNTGTGKTALLHELGAHGIPVLDLEKHANHRGSVLGGMALGPQPSQKQFESDIYEVLSKLVAEKPVLVEAESTKIGRLSLPPSLREALQQAPALMIMAPLPARVAHLLNIYQVDMLEVDLVAEKLGYLRAIRGHKMVDQWIEMVRQQEWPTLVSSLLEDHYDPAYEYGRVKRRLISGRHECILLEDGSVDVQRITSLQKIIENSFL